MPNYTYKCKKCETKIEVFHGMNELHEGTCEEDNCDGLLEKQIGIGSGIIFKGSGFYQTDYKNK
jgi:putative FmdB family regulatory protein